MPDEPYDQTISDAAAFLGVHVRTVQKWANDGALDGYRTKGTHWRFRKSALEAFVEARRTRPAEASA